MHRATDDPNEILALCEQLDCQLEWQAGRVFDVFQIVLAQSRYSMASFTYYQLINSRAMGYSSASSVITALPRPAAPA